MSDVANEPLLFPVSESRKRRSGTIRPGNKWNLMRKAERTSYLLALASLSAFGTRKDKLRSDCRLISQLPINRSLSPKNVAAFNGNIRNDHYGVLRSLACGPLIDGGRWSQDDRLTSGGETFLYYHGIIQLGINIRSTCRSEEGGDLMVFQTQCWSLSL